VIELDDGSLGIIEKKSQKASANKSPLNTEWSLCSVSPELYQRVIRAIKLNYPIFYTTYKTTGIYDKKNKKKLVGFNVSLARKKTKLAWHDLFPDDPVPAEAQWTIVAQTAKKQGQYLVVTHTSKDGKSKQVNEYKLEIEKISRAIYDSTMTFKTFPFNIPHSHKITEKKVVTYDRSMDEWEQHVEQKGLLEDSNVQRKRCSNCSKSFFDTSSQQLCFSCCTAEQAVTHKQAIKLCKQAEKLSSQTDWQQTANSVKQLQADWQQLKSMSREDSEKLWARFQKATQRFFDARSKHFDQQDKVRMANKKKAKRIITKAKKFSGSTEWKETADAIKILQQEWKAVNPLPRDDADELWQQFRSVTQTFFDRRAAHFDDKDSQRNENRRKAECLIEKAQRWSGSDDWKQAGDELKTLQQQWKEVNPLPREDADTLWCNFQGLCQTFFDRRAAHYNKRNSR
jgi:hypothetical protein